VDYTNPKEVIAELVEYINSQDTSLQQLGAIELLSAVLEDLRRQAVYTLRGDE